MSAAAQDRPWRDALYALTHRQCETDLLRKIADDHDCGGDCAFADADAMRDLADAIDTANAATEADVLRAIDSCGGVPDETQPEWSRGYNDALNIAVCPVCPAMVAQTLPSCSAQCGFPQGHGFAAT